MNGRHKLTFLFLGCFILFVLGNAQHPSETSTSSENPGLALKVNRSGLSYLKDLLVNLLRRLLPNQTFPRLSKNEKNLRYSINSLQVTTFEPGNTLVSTRSPNIFTVSTTRGRIAATVDFNFAVKLWFIWIRKSGTLTVTGSNISLSQSVGLDIDQQGRPTFLPLVCSSDIETISVRVSGTGLDTVFNFLLGLFRKDIRAFLNSKICEIIPNLVRDSGQELTQAYPVSVGCFRSTRINLGMTRGPAADSNSVGAQIRARIYSPAENSNQIFPFYPPTMPPFSTAGNSKMAQISLSDYTLNTLLYSLWQQGFFSRTLSQEELFSFSSLNASTMTDAGLGGISFLTSFMESDGLQFSISAPIAPNVSFSQSGVTLDGEFHISIVTENEEEELSLTLGILGNGYLFVNGTSVGANLTNVNVVVLSSAGLPPGVGTIFNQVFETYFPVLVLPAINEFANVGFEIPDIFEFSPRRISLEFKQNALEIAGDIENS